LILAYGKKNGNGFCHIDKALEFCNSNGKYRNSCSIAIADISYGISENGYYIPEMARKFICYELCYF
jgi:hypothetical protein